MPIEITMPQLSDTMTEGTVIKWLKKEGDKIKAGEVIAEIETDKANMEMEAFDGGTLALIAAKEGAKVNVGGVIAVLASSKEDPAAIKTQYANKPAAAAAATAPKAASAPAAAPIAGAKAAAPAPAVAQAPRHLSIESEDDVRQAPSQARAAATAVAPVPAGRAVTGPLPGKGNGEDRLRSSPIARKLARENGIDLARVRGTGPGGRILEQDVLAVLASGSRAAAPVAEPPRTISSAPSASTPAAGSLPVRVASGQKEVVPLAKMRQVIAQRLQASKQTIPHYYETIDADVEEVSRTRELLNEQLQPDGVRLSIGDFVVKALACALVAHPALNASFNGTELTRYGDVHLGLAVALPDGLIVPVLRNVNQMGLREIRQRSAELVDRARKQKLKQDEMTGATFTVSNLGSYGIREFSAIINPPEVGILAVGAAAKRAEVREGQIVARLMLTLTLSADHRVVDGATAAEFMRTLKSLLEEPAAMLVM